MADGNPNAGDSKDSEKHASWDIIKFIEKTPCSRDSLLYGITGGLGAGVLYFFKSNHVRRSADVAVGSFALISVVSWELCRYMRHKEHQKIKKTVELMNEQSKNNKDEPKQA
ncbi:cytochrome c oxidase assembly protein COX20, mitochondrial-like [Actinia tenebrosa]|uniref:Cytochrome c oxidase assembly protein COX20, mitochondrial n=1 Tax=Actinia tenebrosa TaxID=6105 RepID=A0A6P8J4Y6_ACTTE|nr:cytochrome c oxidase assembly protein COX20, mitochondrial-like [Actinia tenebrosa]